MRAFSLIELSIVLVILGLLVGRIVTGQGLIRAAGLRETTQQYSQITSAYQTFRGKYMALPGDIVDPLKYGLLKSADYFAPGTTAGNGALECTNGAIEYSRRTGGCEQTMSIFHLRVTGMLPGPTDSMPPGYRHDAATTEQLATWYIPTKLSDGSLWIPFWDYKQGAANPDPRNAFAVMKLETQAGSTYNPSTTLYPETAWNIDVKLDDGLPGSGKVQAILVYNSFINYRAAATSNCVENIGGRFEYKLSNQSAVCGLVFEAGF